MPTIPPNHDARPVAKRLPRLHRFFRTAAIALACLCPLAIATAQTWKPVWGDEFNSTVAGAPPDASKWTYDVGAGKWGNRELETYCAPASSTPAPCDAQNPNAFQNGKGQLVIQALRTSPDPAPTGTWTSGRLKTRGVQDFQYGRMEACMRLPIGPGLWPAFWMLGTVGPGFSGEIDIMENVPKSGQKGGLGPTIVETTIHGARPNGPGRLFSLAADYTLPNGGRIDDPTCHIYGAIWSPSMIQMYVDDWRSPYFIRTASDVPPDGKWVFNAPNRFYFLMNLAVGGQWPGPPDATTPGPSQVLVDYVRVYEADPVEPPAIAAPPFELKSGATGSTTITLNRGVNRVYLACSGAPAGSACAIDTGNSLGASVADFSAAATQTARLTLKPAAESSGPAAGSYSLTVTAHTISGSQASLQVPVVIN